MNESFIVTGGAGFIGSNLVRALNARGCADILVVDHVDHPAKAANLEGLTYGRYLDKDEFRQALRAGRLDPVSGVFHLGACSSTTETDEEYLRDNNTRYTRELCQWALEVGARFVYASSAATYGDGSLGYDDDDAVTPSLTPLNPYGRSKQNFDLWAMRHGLLDRIAGLKYFNVYGPGEDHKGDMRSVVNKAYASVMDEGVIRLFRSHREGYGDGLQQRDFIHVADAAAVTLFFYDYPEVSGLFNAGTGEARSWLDLARAVFAAVERPENIVFVDMPEAIREKYQYYTRAETAKLRRAGFAAPFLSLEEGVRRYVRDYLSVSKHSPGKEMI